MKPTSAAQEKNSKIYNFRAPFGMKPSKFFKLFRCVYNITNWKIPCSILSFFFFNLLFSLLNLLDCPNSKLIFTSLNITIFLNLKKPVILYSTLLLTKYMPLGVRTLGGIADWMRASLKLSKYLTTELHPKAFKKKADIKTWFQT